MNARIQWQVLVVCRSNDQKRNPLNRVHLSGNSVLECPSTQRIRRIIRGYPFRALLLSLVTDERTVGRWARDAITTTTTTHPRVWVNGCTNN